MKAFQLRKFCSETIHSLIKCNDDNHNAGNPSCIGKVSTTQINEKLSMFVCVCKCVCVCAEKFSLCSFVFRLPPLAFFLSLSLSLSFWGIIFSSFTLPFCLRPSLKAGCSVYTYTHTDSMPHTAANKLCSANANRFWANK